MNIGDTFTHNGIDLLVLDIIDSKPFVLAYNLDIKTPFSEISNNYKESTLREKCENWFMKTGFKAQSRVVDLTTADGSEDYGTLSTKVAPLTLNEYRKYEDIMFPYIKWFWTATGWNRRKSEWDLGYICYANIIFGITNNFRCDFAGGNMAPAFIIEELNM
jgi:hypothetical protein